MRGTAVVLSSCLLGVALLGDTASAQNYKFKTLDLNNQDQTYLMATGGSKILGWDIPQGGNPACNLIEGKNRILLEDPNATVTFCYGVNAKGTIVGYYEDVQNIATGFVYSNGTWTDFSLPNGAPGPSPLGISPSGMITGYYYENNQPWGFVLKGSKVKTFQISGAAYIFPDGINDKGDVSIQEVDAEGNLHCYVMSNGTFANRDYPGAVQSSCNGVDNTGVIVGYYFDQSGATRGYAYDPSTQSYYTVDYPGAADTQVVGVGSDAKTLVGLYYATNGGPAQGLKATGTLPVSR